MRLSLVIVILLNIVCAYGMTKSQLKKTLSITKRQCMPKNGVTEDQVGHIEEGKFVENHNVMCYTACIYKLTQVVKNNKLNMDLLIKQVDILYPTDMKEGAKKAAYACIHVQDNYNDICEAVFYTTKCFYEFDPSNFIFA